MKLLFLCVFYVSSFVSLSQAPINGLVSYYKFDNTLKDSGPNQLHGTPLSELNYNEGTKCQAVVINDNLQDGVSLENSTINGLNDFSISFYVQLFGLNNSNNVLSCANEYQPNEFLIGYNSINKTEFNGWHIRVNNTIYSFEFDDQVEDLNWHHVVIQRGGNRATLYIDNHQIGNDIIVDDKTLNVAENGVIIGQDQDVVAGGFDPKQNLNGALDELRIYDRMLSESEISAIYNSSACYVPIVKEEVVYVTITDTVLFRDTITVNEVVTVIDTISVTDTLLIYLHPENVGSTEKGMAKVIKIFPNPTSDYVTIFLGKNYSSLYEITVQIVSISGQTVFESYLNQESLRINTTKFSDKGVYLIRIKNEDGKVLSSKRLFIQ